MKELHAYPKYKDSGVAWLGGVPECWDVVRLKFLARVNPSKSEVNNLQREMDVQFLPMELVNSNGTYSLDEIRQLQEVYSGFTYFKQGDIILAKITPCYENGKGALLNNLKNEIGFGSTEFHVLRPNKGINPFFLWYHTVADSFRKLGKLEMKGAVGQQRVPEGFISNYPVAIPQLHEQSQVVSFLDGETSRIDVLIAEKQNFVSLLKEKRQALITHVVTKGLDPDMPMKDSGVEWLGDIPEKWTVRPLFTVGNESKLPNKGMIEDNLLSLSYGKIVQKSIKTLEGLLPESFETYQIIGPNNIIFRLTDLQNDKRSLRSAISTQRGIITNAYVAFKPSTISPNYLSYLMRSYDTTKVFYNLGSGLRQSLRYDELKRMPIIVPPNAEQNRIVSFLEHQTDRIDKLIYETNLSIDLLKEKRSSLITATVSGKIDVRNYYSDTQDNKEAV